jgi:hypothetical protein
MPPSASAPINGCSEFTIPNTLYQYFGTYDWADYLFGPIPSWREALKNMAATYKNLGYNVVVTDPSTAATARSHLTSEDVYIWQYAGHGGGTGQLNFTVNDTLVPSRLTQYGIAFLDAYACDSAIEIPYPPQLAGVMGYVWSAWKKNVSTRGLFNGIYGAVNGCQAWSQQVSTPGTNTH